jgi:hypothetical protein
MPKKRLLLNLKMIVIFLATVSSACAQMNRRELTDQDDAKVEFEFLGKSGETTVQLIDLKNVPNGTRLPTGYSLLANKAYNIKNTAIEYGETVVSFKVPVASKEQFQTVRILKLRFNELNPSGFEWGDCTIAGPDFPYLREDASSESRKERIAKFSPDFSKKQISCGLDDRLEPDNYFALSTQTSQLPTEPVTQIVTKLESSVNSTESAETTYILSFRNAGNKSVSEVNFYSHFDDDSILVSANPGKGRCRKATLGSSTGSVVCHLGALTQGATVNVEFIARPSRMGGLTPRPRPNFNWLIEGFVKENPDDSTLPLNGFTFEPVAK